MLRSSLGFHTITLSLDIKYNEVMPLIRRFNKYRMITKSIETYTANKKGENIQVYRPREGSYPPTYLNIVYPKYRGIKWSIRCNNWDSSFKGYYVEAIINPKLLGGIIDYINASTFSDMEAAIKKFNLEAKSISPTLKDFYHYHIKRVDYCINFALDELVPGCSPEQIMKLIKRGDMPPYYKEWKEYDPIAHRTKTKKSSFYLVNPSVNINCYMKYEELLERSQKYEGSGYSQITLEMLDEAKDIIRFEVQCKYHKMYTLNNRAEESGNCRINKYESLLSDETCHETIDYYFKKFIGIGDWYTMYQAIRTIKFNSFNSQKEKRLVNALKFVNDCHSLAEAKTAYQGNDLKAFERAIKELSNLGINPVIIPKNWGIKHIPNLLHAYFDKVQDEKDEEAFWAKELDKTIKEFGYPV